MERRFRVRLGELLDDARVHPGLLRGMATRLEEFVRPFAESFGSDAPRRNATRYVQGLLSNLGAKNVEAIAYLHDRERQGLQKFIGQADWDHTPLLAELARQVGAELGEPDAVLVFDPSAFPKKGTASVGVQRQWCGRLGKLENCQVGVYMGYVSRIEHALVDLRLYLPKEWADKKRRRKKAGVPAEIRFQTRHEQALEMLREKGVLLPHTWIAGDDEMGRSSKFRGELRALNERYLLAVPSNTLIRDGEEEPPVYSGRGPRPKVPFRRVDRWAAVLPANAWQTIEVRPGEKGPLATQLVKRRVQAKEGRQTGPDEILVVTREQQADGSFKHDYYLSSAVAETPLQEFARVTKAGASHRGMHQACQERSGLGRL